MHLKIGQAVVVTQDTVLEDGTRVPAGTSALATRIDNVVQLATLEFRATGQTAENVPYGDIITDPNSRQPIHVLLERESDL